MGFGACGVKLLVFWGLGLSIYTWKNNPGKNLCHQDIPVLAVLQLILNAVDTACHFDLSAEL